MPKMSEAAVDELERSGLREFWIYWDHVIRWYCGEVNPFDEDCDEDKF